MNSAIVFNQVNDSVARVPVPSETELHKVRFALRRVDEEGTVGESLIKFIRKPTVVEKDDHGNYIRVKLPQGEGRFVVFFEEKEWGEYYIHKKE